MLNLGFDSAVPGSILDKDGEGTGFTSVQANTSGNQQESSLINLDATAGKLTLTATQGSNATANTLKNGLQYGLNATKTFTISTRISSPFTDLTQNNQQGGLFVGSGQDDYAKLVAVRTSSGLSIQFYKEEGGVGLTVGQISTLNWASIKTLDLYLTGDRVANKITAAYRVNSNTSAPIALTQSSTPSQSASFFSATNTNAGILAFTKDSANVPITFNYFGIAQDVNINFQPSTASIPTGYIVDSGQAYDATRGYGWVTSGTRTALSISQYARDRDRSGIDQKLDTLLHMQYSGTPAAAWEYAVPNGTYSVVVSVGDKSGTGGVYDSTHTIRVENKIVINGFKSTANEEYHLATTKVDVIDGRLTVDAIGGTNTKINYLKIVNITPGAHPSIKASSIDTDTSTGLAYRNTSVALDLSLVANGVDPGTLNISNVQLYSTKDGISVPGQVGTSGGGDSIVYQPTNLLAANTNYTFRVTSAVRDDSTIGTTFIPYSTTFNTGNTTSISATPGVSFTKSLVYGDVDKQGDPISSLTIGPDGKLYAAGLDGKIRRWTINSSGTLSNLQTFSPSQLAGRAIIGLTFDPNNSSNLWITSNDPLFPRPAEDFTGKVSKLTLGSGTNFTANIQDYVVNLPRASKDHLTNSLAFHGGKLYLSQGSNSAMGAPNDGWNNRLERMLGASILEIDPTRTPASGGFNVQTENYKNVAGNYDPTAANAPVKIYASGVRNAYDLVWHSNGYLYAPTNGSAYGGNTPDNPATTVNEALINVGTQNDYLYKVEKGGYYGHPNPKQKHYILNGGNPTSAVNPAEVVATNGYAGYSVGTQPDPDYKFFAYDFGRSRSPDGAIEYKSDTFSGALKNKLLVTEYSGGDDILAISLDANGNVPSGKTTVTQLYSGLKNPLDLTEDTNNGNLYVSELKEDGSNYYGQITLLKAKVV